MENTPRLYRIESTSGIIYGIYEAESPEEAFVLMVDDVGGQIGSPEVGTAANWIIEEVQR